MIFEESKYINQSCEEIETDLRGQGFKPLLIKEHPNTKLDEHSHPQHHILVVTKGKMNLSVNDDEMVMKPGDKITILPKEKHAAYFGEEGCEYYWIEY